MFPPLAGGVVSDSWSAGGASSGTDGMPLNHNLLLVRRSSYSVYNISGIKTLADDVVLTRLRTID